MQLQPAYRQCGVRGDQPLPCLPNRVSLPCLAATAPAHTSTQPRLAALLRFTPTLPWNALELVVVGCGPSEAITKCLRSHAAVQACVCKLQGPHQDSRSPACPGEEGCLLLQPCMHASRLGPTRKLVVLIGRRAICSCSHACVHACAE